MILTVEDVHSYYADSHILHGVSLFVADGEVVALLGRNGMGKTTTLKTILGLVSARSGTIRYRGEEITGESTYQIIRRGIGYVPAERRIFSALTVRENLEVAVRNAGHHRWTVETIYNVFPLLKKYDRSKGGNLSGGEQQMLSIARTLMGNPNLLLLDEPTEGLSPLMVKSVGDQIQNLKTLGVSIILAEMNVKFALKITTRAYILEKGRVSSERSSRELEEDAEAKRFYLAV